MSISKSTTTYFLNLKSEKSKFNVYTKDLEAGSYNTETDQVSGKLISISVMHDEGTPKKPGKAAVEPYDYLSVSLFDEEAKEWYVLKSKMKISFTKNLIAQLTKIAKNEGLTIKIMPGDNPKVTLVRIYRDVEDAEGKKTVSFTGYGDDIDKALEDIKGHEAYKEYNPVKKA